jgi:glycerophosphodiester phosphodiesterase
MEHLMGVDGVIVDLVEEITEAISGWIKPAEDREQDSFLGEEVQMQAKTSPGFSQQQLSSLLELPPELSHA